MSTKLKLYLGRKIIESLNKTTKTTPIELLRVINVGNQYPNNNLELQLPIQYLEKQWGLTNVNEILKIQPDDIIKNIRTQSDRANRSLSFEVDRSIFIKDVIENGANPELNMKPKKIVVEFSSPNIAKPFHFGHLRSTIIGNFISNMHRYMSNKVTKLNYLGDWGTQFGLIKVGVEELNLTPEQIKANPLQLLYQAYVYANKLAEENPAIRDRAKAEFNRIETGDADIKKTWQEYVTYSKKDLEKTYKRLGIEFDDYNFESTYHAKGIVEVLNQLMEKNIVEREKDGVVRAKINDTKKVAILKSDGSTLYLTRDIAAAIDRYNKYNFDKMFYVVDNSQIEHFNALKHILFRMGYNWGGRIQHVRFGRVSGMSSRKGNVIFLRDILDQCRDSMIKKQIESPTTKTAINDGETADILGLSCIIINDLKQRRQKDYDFNWDNALQINGETGVKLQYTHCRLVSLEENNLGIPLQGCNPVLIEQHEITAVIREIAKFPEIIHKSNEQLEACYLVKYLFQLCNVINKMFANIQVKGQPPDIACQRLLVFRVAREVLAEGMKILGLQPLQKM